MDGTHGINAEAALVDGFRMEWIERVLKNPIRTEVQPNGRIRYWGYIAERKKYLRVVLEPDGETLHNAFFDRRFKP